MRTEIYTTFENYTILSLIDEQVIRGFSVGDKNGERVCAERFISAGLAMAWAEANLDKFMLEVESL